MDIVRAMALPYGKIVDIGCNIGETFGDRATNVDKRTLQQKREEAKDPNLIIPNFVHADAEKLPFKDLEYDVAVLSEILEHVDDPVKVLNEAQRIAKIIIICVPNEYEWSEDKKPFWSPDHKRWYTEQTILQLCIETNLKLMNYFKMSYDGWSYFVIQGISRFAYFNPEAKK
jgi:ubiquinone/menaquinone biosynthesis C-methylase UbiE